MDTDIARICCWDGRIIYKVSTTKGVYNCGCTSNVKDQLESMIDDPSLFRENVPRNEDIKKYQTVEGSKDAF